MPAVLTLLMDGFEELEAVAPIDLLRRAGAEVTLAALEREHRVTGRNGLVMQAETTLDAIAGREFDML
ncbi:MAG: DJ-1/PfpI family protein, partial [Opitutaceae bacterium]|nr:DJ-1/PfpI family protein [Opitutaceae bacterium]